MAYSMKAGKLPMRILAVAIVILGAVLLILSLLADTVGIGEAPKFFGWKQVAGIVGGAVMILTGFIFALPRVDRN